MNFSEQELRIGNYLQTKDASIVKVSGLMYDKIVVRFYDKLSDRYNVQVEPIPLTEEWPKKFNWNRVGEDVWTKDYGLWTYQLENHPGNPNGYVLFIDVPGVATPPAYHVDYIHHWQNIIHALTGEEL